MFIIGIDTGGTFTDIAAQSAGCGAAVRGCPRSLHARTGAPD